MTKKQTSRTKARGKSSVPSLTPKQQAFCEHYITSLNATGAARKAGYKQAEASGHENLQKPKVRQYIDSKLEDMSKKRIMTAEEVLEYLTSVARGEETDEVLKVRDGDSYTDEMRVKSRDRIKAAELLGKRHALFVDKLQVDGPIPEPLAPVNPKD